MDKPHDIHNINVSYSLFARVCCLTSPARNQSREV